MISQQMLFDYLSGSVLTDLANALDIAPGLPKPFPPAFYQPSPTEVIGINAQWEATEGVRTPSRATDYLSAARGAEANPRVRKYANALGTREQLPLDGELITALQMGNLPLWQQRAKTILRQRMLDFRERADNFATTLVHSAVALGAIYVDRNGNILPSATNASVTVNYNLKYGGSNALNKTSYWPSLPAEPASLVGDWSDTAFDIPASARALKDSFVKTSNYMATTIIYGRSVPTYLYENTALQTYMSRQPMINQNFLMSNEVPQGMLDFKWYPGYNAYYVDQNGNVQNFVADNQIIVFPEISPNWYEDMVCSIPCPKGMVQPSADIQQFLDACPPVRGYSSYVIPCWNPIKLDFIAQYYTLPVLKNPYFPYVATVS